MDYRRHDGAVRYPPVHFVSLNGRCLQGVG
jgi:hypothetical protein